MRRKKQRTLDAATEELYTALAHIKEEQENNERDVPATIPSEIHQLPQGTDFEPMQALGSRKLCFFFVFPHIFADQLHLGSCLSILGIFFSPYFFIFFKTSRNFHSFQRFGFLENILKIP